MKPLLKVCGVNDAAFAVEAERLGADYLGFIFVPGTPRAVTVERAAGIIAGLSGRAKRVGVFVRDAPDAILPVAQRLGLQVIQLHRRATVEDVRLVQAHGLEVWTLAGGAPGDGVLFDTSHGDGETCFRTGPWKTVLAGGISEANLASALTCRPTIIDVSGSLEVSPGVKDIVRLRNFMAVWNRSGM